MRLPLAMLEVFSAIVRNGTMKAAAESLGVQPSTVSHQLKALENRIGTPLFIRSTRSLALTEAGQVLRRGTMPAFEQLDSAMEQASEMGGQNKGTLKIALPEFALSMLIGTKLASFRSKYPEINLEISVSDAFEDIVTGGFHAGVRLGDRVEEDMIALRISPPLPRALFASQRYIDIHGIPSDPRDLIYHQCIRYRFQSSGEIFLWEFSGPNGDFTVEPKNAITTNSHSSLYALAASGMGIAYGFRDYPASIHLDTELVPFFDDLARPTPGLFVYFPSEYRSLSILRALLDHLRSYGE